MVASQWIFYSLCSESNVLVEVLAFLENNDPVLYLFLCSICRRTKELSNPERFITNYMFWQISRPRIKNMFMNLVDLDNLVKTSDERHMPAAPPHISSQQSIHVKFDHCRPSDSNKQWASRDDLPLSVLAYHMPLLLTAWSGDAVPWFKSYVTNSNLAFVWR